MIYEKMDDCFSKLNERINYCVDNTNLQECFSLLESIKGPTLVTGVGGSSIVAKFMAKVLSKKNHIIAEFSYPRDLLYKDLSAYENVIACSFSSGNIGIDASFDNNLKKYLFSTKDRPESTTIKYVADKESAYLSISATFAPMAVLLLYYQNDKNILNEILKEEIKTTSNANIYEVMKGFENETAATVLETSFAEGGMAPCILHDKYNYCHGRINLTKLKQSDLIFFKEDNELDDVLYNGIVKYYNNVITINRKYEDDIINDFYQSYVSLMLIYEIAKNKNIDVCDMIELPDNDVYFLFKGKMKK